MERYQALHGEILPGTSSPGWLVIEHVLQRYRDVWVPIDTYPYLAVDLARVEAHCAETQEFAVFANGILMQNIRKEEGGRRMIAALMGGGVDAGMSAHAKVVVEGIANPRANWMMYFNDPFMIGMYPFAALDTRYIYIDSNGTYQREFGELVIVGTHSRPRSAHVNFDPLAEMARAFHDQYIIGSRDRLPNVLLLTELLDSIFVENEKILAAARCHHRTRAPNDQAFDYVAPILTHYGRLTHDANRAPRIELSYALVHYEKALREFNDLQIASATGDVERSFFHGVYCVVAIAACIEAIANKLVFQQTGQHPDHRDKRQPLQKLNEAGSALRAAAGHGRILFVAGQPQFDALNRVRELRNAFMHAKERDEEVDPQEGTSALFSEVSEANCRNYLRQLRLAVAQVYAQLSVHTPIVTDERVTWFGDLEVP